MSKATKSMYVMLMALCVQSPVLGHRSALMNDELSCRAAPSWFPRTPSPTNATPNPDLDCDFYKWAWQTFLFVTQFENGRGVRPRFLEFLTPSELFDLSANHRLRPIRKRHIPSNLNAVVQPGSRAVLVDQNGRAVYYATHLNPVFVKFIRDGRYTDLAALKDVPPTQQFPRGSLELKSSWKILAPGEDASRFFTIRTVIPLLTLKHGRILLEPAQSREETVALVGLHVVGVVEGHPEFIWATFEHNDNAPDLPAGLGPDAGEPVDTQRSWTLYPKGAKAADCNKKPGHLLISQLQLVDKDKQTLYPKASVFRQFPFGGDDEPEIIRGLNESVHGRLSGNLAVWKNYNLMGAVWLNTPDRDFKENVDFALADRSGPTKKILGGDKKLSNTTMETFGQSTQNCFSCHNTTAHAISAEEGVPAKRLNVSHVLTTAYMLLKPGKQSSAPRSLNAPVLLAPGTKVRTRRD